MALFCCNEKRRFRQTGYRPDGSAKGYSDICQKCNGKYTKTSKRKRNKDTSRKLPTCGACFKNEGIVVRVKGHDCPCKTQNIKKPRKIYYFGSSDEDSLDSDYYDKYYASDSDTSNKLSNDNSD